MIRIERNFALTLVVLMTACTAENPSPTSITPQEPGGGGISVGTPQVSTAVASTGVVITAVAGTIEPDLPPDQQGTAIGIPAPTPIPHVIIGLSPYEVKYLILAEYPDFFFCDPDYYPVARDDEMVLARQRFPEIQANTEAYAAILAHLGLSETQFTDDEVLQIYREYKRLNAVPLEVGDASYSFQIQVAQTEGQGELITGMVDEQGEITVLERQQTFATCPICLAEGTLIDTPGGAMRVEALRPGMLVWTQTATGERVAEQILAVGKTAAPSTHRVVRFTLEDGRVLTVSAGHPTSDGRTLGMLAVGDNLDGAVIIRLEHVRYVGSATYDLLPAGGTGFYWANGILIGSTLSEDSQAH